MTDVFIFMAGFSAGILLAFSYGLFWLGKYAEVSYQGRQQGFIRRDAEFFVLRFFNLEYLRQSDDSHKTPSVYKPGKVSRAQGRLKLVSSQDIRSTETHGENPPGCA